MSTSKLFLVSALLAVPIFLGIQLASGGSTAQVFGFPNFGGPAPDPAPAPAPDPAPVPPPPPASVSAGLRPSLYCKCNCGQWNGDQQILKIFRCENEKRSSSEFWEYPATIDTDCSKLNGTECEGTTESD